MASAAGSKGGISENLKKNLKEVNPLNTNINNLCKKEDLKNGLVVWLKRRQCLISSNLPNTNWDGMAIISMIEERNFHILIPESDMKRIDYEFKKDDFPQCVVNEQHCLYMFPFSIEKMKSSFEEQEIKVKKDIEKKEKAVKNTNKKLIKLKKKHENIIKAVLEMQKS